MGEPFRVFISYSHKDTKLKDALLEQLKVLEQFHRVVVWSDDQIPAGAVWRDEISNALGAADVALLLVTAPFLASRFINDVEIPTLLKRNASAGLIVIPVILSDCLWQHHPALEAFQALPKDAKPITSHTGNKKARALKEVAEAIAAMAKKRAASTSHTTLAAEHTATPKSDDRTYTASAATGLHPQPLLLPPPAPTRSRRSVIILQVMAILTAVLCVVVYYFSRNRFRVQGQLFGLNSGNPISHAKVLMVGLSCGYQIVTDENGLFLVDCRVPIGTSLKDPRIQVKLPGKDSFCMNPIKLLPSDNITIILIDEKDCQFVVSSALDSRERRDADIVTTAMAETNEVEVKVTVNASNSRVFVDSNPMAGNPFVGKFPKDSRPHEIRAEAPGYESKTRTILSFETNLDIEVILEKNVAPTPAPPRVESPPPPPVDDMKEPLPRKPKRELDPNNPYP
jgi:hypothetical protein